MSRSGVPSSFSNDSTNLFYAVEFAFDDGFVRLWTGYGNISIDSNTYYGLGKCLSISPITETNQLSVTGITIAISGITSSNTGDSNLLSDAMSKDLQGRKMKCMIGSLDGSRVASSYVLFVGALNTLNIEDNSDSSILMVRCDSRLIEFARSRTLRYTDNEQKWLYADYGYEVDSVFEQIDQIVNRQISWKPDP